MSQRRQWNWNLSSLNCFVKSKPCLQHRFVGCAPKLHWSVVFSLEKNKCLCCCCCIQQKLGSQASIDILGFYQKMSGKKPRRVPSDLKSVQDERLTCRHIQTLVLLQQTTDENEELKRKVQILEVGLSFLYIIVRSGICNSANKKCFKRAHRSKLLLIF